MIGKRLPTCDGRAKVLLPALALSARRRVWAEDRRIGPQPADGDPVGGDGHALGMVDTAEGTEIRSYCPEADAFVLSLLGADVGRAE